MAFERCVADLESGTAGLCLRLRPGGDRHGARTARQRRARRRDATISTAAPTGCSSACASARPGSQFSFVDLARPRRSRSGDPARHADDLGRDADQSAAEAGRSRRRSPSWRKRRGILAVADNTFASPYVQRPLELGFDIVVHSATKYLNGHSDMIGGIAVVGENAGAARAADASCRTRSARSPGPFDSFLALRGLKTLALRMERHCANALADRRAGWSAIRRSRASTIPASQAIRSTRWPSGRCAASAAWSRSMLKGGARRRAALPRALPALRAGRKPRRRREPDRASRRS